MSLVPYQESNYPVVVQWGLGLLSQLLNWGFGLLDLATYRTYEIYYWLNDVAPIVVKYKLRQIGFSGIDKLPYLSWATKQEIKRWLKENL